MRSLLKIFFCIFLASLGFYSHLEKQNELTELRMEIPILERQVRAIEEENKRLKFMIAHFENPEHLLELLQNPLFHHLHLPEAKEVIELPHFFKGEEGMDIDNK